MMLPYHHMGVGRAAHGDGAEVAARPQQMEGEEMCVIGEEVSSRWENYFVSIVKAEFEKRACIGRQWG